MSEWVLSEEDIKKIIETEPIKIKESEVLNTIILSEDEQLQHARKILDNWKKTK